MDLDLNQLRAFMEAVRAGSYTRAARRLHVSQSAISHAIRKLERSAGSPLVTRRGRGFVLTEAGADVYAASERIFAELQQASARLMARRSGVRLRARLGATVEFGTTVLIGKLAPYLAAHPDLHVDFLFSHDLMTPLLHDEIDLAIECKPHTHPSLERLDLFREKYAVIASPRCCDLDALRAPADLAAMAVLSLDADGAWWDNLLRALPVFERPVFRRIVAVNHVRAIINAAIAGIGVGLAPKYTVLRELADGTLIELFPELPLLEDTFRIYQKKARAKAEANRMLTDFLLRMNVAEFGDAIGAPTAHPAGQTPPAHRAGLAADRRHRGARGGAPDRGR